MKALGFAPMNMCICSQVNMVHLLPGLVHNTPAPNTYTRHDPGWIPSFEIILC